MRRGLVCARFVRKQDLNAATALSVAHLEFAENNLFGTYVFKRADFDKCRPTGLLPSLKPTIMVKCSPVVYELRADIEENFLGYDRRPG